MKSNNKGFTLIEVLTVVTLMAVLLTVAVPSFAGFLDRQRIKADALAIAKTLSTARAQALVVESGSVTVRWNATAAAVDIDPANAAVGQILPGEIVAFNSANGEVLVQRSFEGSETVLADNDTDNSVTFNARGRLGGQDADIVGFLVCRRAGDNANAIRVEIANSGRVTQRLQTDAVGLRTLNCPA